MSTTTRAARTETASAEIPAVPLTIEGYSVLHQMMRFRWAAWRTLRRGAEDRDRAEAQRRAGQDGAEPAGQSALFSLLGHKGDLMFVHFRDTFDELNQAELELSRNCG